MQTISATEIKENSGRLQEALRDDILIAKRGNFFCYSRKLRKIY